MKLNYPYKIEKDEDGKLTVQFVDFEEAFTEGDSPEEAAFNAQEVLSLVIAQRLEDGQGVPMPSTKETGYKAAPDVSVQAALLVKGARAAASKSMADLARLLDTSWPAAQRLEDPRHASSLKQLERAAAALGRRLVLSFDEVELPQLGHGVRPVRPLGFGKGDLKREVKGRSSAPAARSQVAAKRTASAKRKRRAK